MSARVLDGDCLAVMPTLDASSVDAIVCDPPYGLSFMGKAWDHGVPGVEFWTAALGVAKPGAYLVAFGGTRTYHRLTCAIEDAGWEVRDCLSWLYGSGFPKSRNGVWGGTALKPAWEPIILARKPLIGTVAANHAEHGTGALNIDGCRIASDDQPQPFGSPRKSVGGLLNTTDAAREDYEAHSLGRWPANVVLDEDAARELDAQSGERPGMKRAELNRGATTGKGLGYGSTSPQQAGIVGYDDAGGASRFFYTAKASSAERNAGLDDSAAQPAGRTIKPRHGDRHVPKANHHPTVKPLDLMQWLCRLVTPKGGLILDPFCGSGSTGRAAIAEGFSFIGIELSPEYAEIARARIAEYAPLFGDVA